MIRKALISIILSVVFCSMSYGDDSTIVKTNVKLDTILYLPTGIEGTALGVTDSVDREKKLYQNPTLALFKSMLVPGLGQIGNRRYVKAAAIIGLQAWLISSAVHHGNDASDLRRQFETSTVLSERNALYDQYLSSKDQKNKYTWFAVIVTFVSMFDAFSDAHLSGFPNDNQRNDQKIDLNFSPTNDNGVYASATFSF